MKYLKFEKTLFLIIALISAISFAQEKSANNVVNYGYKEYRAHEQNWNVIEGSNGLLYFGNTDGVLEYDGVNWRLIQLPNQSNLRALAKDDNGRIYVGGINEFGYLSPDKVGKLVYVSLIDNISDAFGLFNDIWDIKILDNKVYFFSYKYIFILENNNLKTIESEHQIWGSFSYNHQMYYHALKKGLMKIEKDSVVDVSFGNFFKDKYIWTYREIEDNKILGLDVFTNKFYTIDLSVKDISSSDFIQQSHFEITKQLKGVEVYTYILLKDGSFGIATLSGFYHVSKDGEFKQKLSSKNGLLTDIIWNLYQDSSGILWLTTDNGISKVDINSQLSHWTRQQGIKSKPLDLLRIDNKLYIASFGGLRSMTGDKVAEKVIFENESTNFLTFKNPERPFLPKYLVSTFDKGIVELSTNKTTKILDASTWVMYQSKSKLSIVYLGTSEGLIAMEFKNSQWNSLGKVSGIDADIRYIYEDDDGFIWLGSVFKGVYKVELSENVLIPSEITQYGLKDNLPSLKNNFPVNINGELFFNTNKGLYHFSEEENKFKPDSLFGIEYCNGSHKTFSFTSDSLGRVWIGGKVKGKSFFSVASPNNEGSYTVKNVPFKEMNEADVSLLYEEKDSTVWFGGPEGLFRFKGKVPQGPKSFSALIRKVEIKKDSVIYFGTKSNTNEGLVQNTPRIDYNLNKILFQFASPFFYSEDLTLYQTKLEGFEEGWSKWSNNQEIEYINLKEGDYKFHVRAKNIYGKISEADVFDFAIIPPWYRSLFAYITYLILISTLIYLIAYFNGRRLKRANVLLEQTVKERTEEIVALKNTYIENLSHEIRTPITIITGYLELIRKNVFDSNKILSYTDKTIKSSESVISYLNDFLTVLKLEKKTLKTQTSIKNMGIFLKELVYSFEGNVTLKNINLFYKTNVKVTRDQFIYEYSSLTKIMNNLITNAIKYSRDGAAIYIDVEVAEYEMCITIKDEGIGISEQDLPHIFSRFFQSKEHLTSGGFGIGLSLVCELVNKLNGKVTVTSKKNNGSVFKVTLPLNFNNEIQIIENSPQYILVNPVDTLEEESVPIENTLPKILIVDDNGEILSFLKELLSKEFNCFTAYNGKDGLILAREHQFVVVLSDLYMPIMQGFEFKEALNKLENYNETPFILLSASPPEEMDALKLSLGIDDFIVKPFKSTEIQSRIYNLLENKVCREKLQNITYEGVEVSGHNSEFVNKVRAIILKNLSNSEFTVNDLAAACNYSSKQLGRILQANTGLTTVKIILEIRLLKAYELIMKHEFQTIKEVTYAVGLNSTDYFNKVFTKRFGVKVSELMK
ncbi:hypothetical protein LPB136_09890 [Tenacibaculum todarodis]|uniref:histidine kinase n=1 Tax=Tenacibaculum todarodis TaxID=1850252 RepID=A0A1L3JKM8_9FLAO|nr:hybrid sensor histidine kinase/response regulator transcription factor [Tenacibaculum todarodis]APG65652.1 hypothetical protein LPB136_09890 [Tenacibaculum todarodis]